MRREVPMFSIPHETVTKGESAAYFLLAVIVCLLLITMFSNPLPKEWFFGLL